MAQTIAQWVKGKLVGPRPGQQEAQIYNPLKLKIGRYVRLDHPDYLNLDFEVEIIEQYTNHIAGQDFQFVAYDLLCRPLGKPPIRVQVRVEPVEDARPQAGPQLQALLLTLHDDISRQEFQQQNNIDLYQIVELDRTGVFQIRDDKTDALQAEYTRPEGLRSFLSPTVIALTDPNHDGIVAPAEVKQRKLQYWDYFRDTPDAAGNPVSEALIVELEDESWWKIWIGRAIPASVIQDF